MAKNKGGDQEFFEFNHSIQSYQRDTRFDPTKYNNIGTYARICLSLGEITLVLFRREQL